VGVQTSLPMLNRPVKAGSPYFADLVEPGQKTHRQEIDDLLTRLQSNKDRWVQLAITERLSIVDEIRGRFAALNELWVHAELEAKALPPGSLGEAEEWSLLAAVHRALRLLGQSLAEIQELWRPAIPGNLTSRPNGQVVAPVFPVTRFDRILFSGISSEVWMEPGLSDQDTIASQATAYHDRHLTGKVTLILAAGNASLLSVSDLIDKLFVELQVVVLKINPVNEHMGPLLEEGFRPLIDRGFLGFVYGGTEEGTYLCNHPAVDNLHLTGSDKTFEAIVFGTGSEGKHRKAERRPLNTKHFSGEFGNVSPVIVVPGPWNKADIDEQAKHIATWVVANAGFACHSPRVIVQHKSWPQRNSLMEGVGRLLRKHPTRQAYYPGAESRHAEYLDAHPEALQLGAIRSGHLPWTIIPDVDPENAGDICFKREAFCTLFAETALPASNIPGFIDRAVDFVNQTVWGTLCVTIIVHPSSLANPEIGAALDRAIAGLHYGTVSLNMPAYYSGYFNTTPWGAFPGSDIYDIQSGTGKTFNLLMFSHPQKSVIWAPFKRPDPLTISSKSALDFGKKLAKFEVKPSWPRLLWLATTALRS